VPGGSRVEIRQLNILYWSAESMMDLLQAYGHNAAMFRFLARRKAALVLADATAVQVVLNLGGPAAMAEVRRSLRWIGPDDGDVEQELTLLLEALTRRLGYAKPRAATADRSLDTIT
jgi:hypothetical protein